MAAVTVDEVKDTVFGDLAVIVAQIDIAADGDTYDTGMDKIWFFKATPADSPTSEIGGTVSGGTITFKAVGAQANCKLLVIGEGR